MKKLFSTALFFGAFSCFCVVPQQEKKRPLPYQKLYKNFEQYQQDYKDGCVKGRPIDKRTLLQIANVNLKELIKDKREKDQNNLGAGGNSAFLIIGGAFALAGSYILGCDARDGFKMVKEEWLKVATTTSLAGFLSVAGLSNLWTLWDEKKEFDSSKKRHENIKNWLKSLPKKN